MRLSLRQKLLLFAVVIAILPLVVAGRTLIRIAQDELKSSANDQLVVTASGWSRRSTTCTSGPGWRRWF
jgi:adenylate cyclase